MIPVIGAYASHISEQREILDTNILTVRLPTQDIEFIEQYAKKHGATVSELVKTYIQSQQASQQGSLHPNMQKITGILPPDMDAQAAYYQLVAKETAMGIMLDLNVMLDVLQQRVPHYHTYRNMSAGGWSHNFELHYVVSKAVKIEN
jgi:hypothetical protein